MTKFRLITTLVLAFAFLFAQVGHAAAAPSAQDTTPISGTITGLTCETDSTTGTNTFLVTVQAADGTSQTVRIDQQTAIDLGLVTADSTGNVDCTDEAVLAELQAAIGTEVEIPADAVIPDEPEEEGSVNPISILLGAFFGEDASVIDGYHEDGFGFGVIAQALWMSKNLTNDASMVEQILQAKKDGSGTFTLSDGTVITYTNWGQLRKALLGKKQNLGQVVSGHANPDDASSQQEHGKGKGNGNGKGNGKGHNKP
jgi:hypothetical protein